MDSSIHLPPELVWGLFTRGLGLLYLVSFVSIWRDILPMAGSRGITPVASVLRAIERDYPGPARFIRFPTLLWIASSDRALRAFVALGIGAALAVVLGLASPVALAICALVYLSLDLALDMLYPWDCLLFEAGALAIFLPALQPLPELAAASVPFAPTAWAFRWLLFRVVFGFGKYKFFGPGKLHLDYLKSFVLSQPLSTPIAYAAFRLPRWIFASALIALFVIEVPIPFLIFTTPELRVFAALAIVGLMIGIQLTGNFGFFNVAVVVLCIPLLDAGSSITDATLASLVWPLDHLAQSALVLYLFLAGLLSLPFNSWIAQAWPYWPVWRRVPLAPLRTAVAWIRTLAPFRLVHAYGVFSPQSGPPVKWVPIIEGTRDGVNWEAYEYRFMPTSERSPPRFIAPYFPRFDHSLIYDALGISVSSFMGSTFGIQNPYRFGRASFMERLAQRLLEGSPEVRKLFAFAPFADAPPMKVRVRLFVLEPVRRKVQRTRGVFWTARAVQTHLRAMELDPSVFDLASPECFHWDEEIWRERSKPFRARLAASEPQELERLLWDRLVPALHASEIEERIASGRSIDDAVARVRAAFDREQLAALQRLVGRHALRAARAIETHLARGAPSWPSHEAPSFFEIGLLAHEAIARGRSVFEAIQRDACRVDALFHASSLAGGLLLHAVLWPGMLPFGARKARLRELTLRAAASHPPALAPGFLRVLSELAKHADRDDEAIPAYVRGPEGWRIDGDAHPDSIFAERAPDREPALLVS